MRETLTSLVAPQGSRQQILLVLAILISHLERALGTFGGLTPITTLAPSAEGTRVALRDDTVGTHHSRLGIAKEIKNERA